MRSNMSGKLIAAMVVVMGMLVLPAQAAVLGPGTTLFPAPGEADPTGGSVIASQTLPFAVPGFFTGSLKSEVISGDPSNPLGGLTFTYVLTNDTASPNAMARMTVQDFTGFQADASFQTPAAGVPPTFIDRLTGDVIGFSFSGIGQGPVFSGMSSAVLVVQTDAPAFVPSSASIIDSGAITVPTFGPFIPEPATLGLVAFGALALIRRR